MTKQKTHLHKNLKQILVNFDGAPEKIDTRDPAPSFNLNKWAYMSIESGPSTRLPTKYCDFTGFKSLYRHKTAGFTGGPQG